MEDVVVHLLTPNEQRLSDAEGRRLEGWVRLMD